MSAEQEKAATKAPAEPEKAAPKGQKQDAPDQGQLEKSITAAKKVVAAQKTAESLKERALKAVNPKERLKLLQDAYHKEIEAHGQSKYAKRLQSGPWQGAAAGGGVGEYAFRYHTVVGHELILSDTYRRRHCNGCRRGTRHCGVRNRGSSDTAYWWTCWHCNRRHPWAVYQTWWRWEARGEAYE